VISFFELLGFDFFAGSEAAIKRSAAKLSW
jgi:hypothetical protein